MFCPRAVSWAFPGAQTSHHESRPDACAREMWTPVCSCCSSHRGDSTSSWDGSGSCWRKRTSMGLRSVRASHSGKGSFMRRTVETGTDTE